MNLLLVDGEADNIKNFRTHIRGAFSSVRIVGHVSEINANILKAVRDLKPDVILADIRFFGGLHFVRFKEIHEEFPDIKFLMYGTFNESDYMKRGRDFGVLDFMYRPVKPSDLNRCLELAVSHHKKLIENRKLLKNMEEDYQQRIFLYEEIFLRSLLNGDIEREREIQNGFEYFEIPFTTDFTVFIVRIDHYKRVALALSEPEKHMKIINILNTVRGALREHKSKAFIRSFHEIPIIVNGRLSVEEKVLLGDRIKHAIFDKTGMRCTIGLGRTYPSPMEIAISAREADAAFGYRYRMGYHAVISIEFVEPDNNITFRYPSERERRLVYSAVVGDYEYCKGLLSELFNALAQSGPMPENLVAKIVMTIVFRISRYISEQNLPFASEVSRHFPTADILRLTTIDDAYQFLDKSLKDFCIFVGKFHTKDSLRLHMAAKRHIQEHYFENFSIARIAVKLGTTPETLNKVFMEREKVMLFDYVMWVRVQEAQKHLAETATEEEIIAVQVGFDDVKYFRSIFKKYVGETPAEFRAKSKE
ncbi:MAG: helix-turn-helix domain-containing protein [Defluviitaleaceae bacterium]|nr:helix-turn-helix domain-containing protein [Defluviitaleaceae bacterium]MCL2264283.1 helix-turn-helix domain-containing protein [Defluviitaleaceae bacterium]